MSQEYQEFIEYIDHLGGIYYRRWGDAPIKTIAVSMFVPRNNTHKYADIDTNMEDIYMSVLYGCCSLAP